MIQEYRAYDEEYLHGAQNNIGNMFDYAVNTCDFEIDHFCNMFLVSGIAAQIGKGNPKYIAGYSGGELVNTIVKKVMQRELDVPVVFYQDKSPEYWCGWSLAFYQWFTCRPFKNILTAVPASRILKLYQTHHEADISRFVETMDMLYKKEHKGTSLERIRAGADMSREELAQRTQLSIGKITFFETGQKDINRCSATTLFRIARCLGCSMEDLMEL